MRYLYHITFTLLFCAVAITSLKAQDIDQERMQRDLNIMESVLEEMFKSEWSAKDGIGTLTSVKMNSNGLSWASNENNTVEGSYFTDYGALFMITNSKPFVLNISSDKEAKGYFSSASGDKGNNAEINRESIVKRISEFLMDYGSTIKQLESDDNVTVIYKANNADQLLTIERNDSLNQTVDTKSVPSMSVSAMVRDLQAYRKGQINESTFSERLIVRDIDPKEESERKLRIMSKILQTSFEDEEPDNFEVNDVEHSYLDGFGAIFKIKASNGSGLFGLNIAFSKLRNKLKKIAESDSVRVSLSQGNTSWSNDDNTENKSPKEVKSAYDNFISTLKETVVDYGRTLSSVQSDENILISLSVSAAGDVVPERVDLQLKKSVLEAFDKGNMSRKQATEQITVREY